MKRFIIGGAALMALACFCSRTDSQDKPIEVRKYLQGVMDKYHRSPDPIAREQSIQNMIEAIRMVRIMEDRMVWVIKNETDRKLRISAIKALGEFGPTAGRSPYIRDLLMHLADCDDDEIRVVSIGVLGTLSPFSKPAIPKFIKFIQEDKNPDIRRRSVGALWAMAHVDKDAVQPAIPVLIAAVNDPDQGDAKYKTTVRSRALEALHVLGPDVESAADSLLKLEANADADIRGESRAALAAAITKDKKVTPIFVLTLNSDQPKAMRRSAAYALGFLGPNAKEAVPDLIRALEAKTEKDEASCLRLKVACAWALGEIGSDAKAAISVLTTLYTDVAPALRATAMASLRKVQAK